MKRIFAIMILTISFHKGSCQHTERKIIDSGYTEDGRKYKIIPIPNDSFKGELKIIFYKNSDLVYEEYTITNNIKDGYDNYYTLSANRYKRILWVEGRKFGCDYFDTLNGNKTESIYYEQVHDTAYPNQHFVFSVNGDTVKEKSFYCSIYSNGHTIKKGDEFVLHAVLEAPIYQKAYIVIGDYDENYNLKRTAKRDTTNMYKFSTKSFSLDYHLGMNTVRGEIVNYEDYKDPITGQKKRRQKELFFRGEYFVKK